MQANHVREKIPNRENRTFPHPVPSSKQNRTRCPFCSAAILGQATVCQSCGQSLKSEATGVIGLKDTLLFAAMLLLLAMVIAPVWPKEQIYGKSILFLMQMGAVIPSSPGDAASFRHQMMNVVLLYQGLNLLHYIFISAFIFFYGVHLIRISKKIPGYSNTVWIALGLLLLVFPIVNLVLSWSMFLSPGVLGTALASISVVIAGKFLK